MKMVLVVKDSHMVKQQTCDHIKTTKSWHWKSYWNFFSHWKNSDITVKIIYKGIHLDNPPEIFSVVVQGHRNYTEIF